MTLDVLSSRTASVLLTDLEEEALRRGLRILYRPLTIHWDGQFGKFKDPIQPTLDGSFAPDLVHLMKEIDRVITDPHGRQRKAIVKVESRMIKEISEESVFPDGYRIKYDNLEPMDQCWAVVLGQKV